MPQESSAVADLVRLAHSKPLVGSPLPGDSQQAPGQPGPSGSGSAWSGAKLVLFGLLVIGASVAGGYFMANQGAGGDPEATETLVASAAGAPGLLDEGNEVPELPATFDPMAEEEVEAVPDEAPAPIDIELAKRTGFDVLVTPAGAKVSLDGQFIGAAPLRVRNLLPGGHAIDIEGPAGYFGKHLEFDLAGGEAEVLTLVLEPVGDDPKSLAGAEGEQPSSEQPVPDQAEEADVAEADVVKSKSAPAANKGRSSKNKRERRRRFKASADEEKILDKAAKVALGTLMLGAKPPCDIFINGKKTGLVTPQRAIQLPAGLHKVLLVNKEHKVRKSFKVRIKSGRTTRAIQDLSSQM